MHALYILLFYLFSTATHGERESGCPYDFSVYVYPLPVDIGPVKLAEEARTSKKYHVCQKCILEQFALEYVMVGILPYVSYPTRSLTLKPKSYSPLFPHISWNHSV